MQVGRLRGSSGLSFGQFIIGLIGVNLMISDIFNMESICALCESRRQVIQQRRDWVQRGWEQTLMIGRELWAGWRHSISINLFDYLSLIMTSFTSYYFPILYVMFPSLILWPF